MGNVTMVDLLVIVKFMRKKVCFFVQRFRTHRGSLTDDLGKKRSEENAQDGYQSCIGEYTRVDILANGIELTYEGGQFSSVGKVTITCDPDAGMFKNVKTTDVCLTTLTRTIRSL